MNLLLIATGAIVLYLSATVWVGYRFFTSNVHDTDSFDSKLLYLGIPALALHGMVLYQLIFTDAGLNMGFYNSLSLISWVVTLLIVLITMAKRTINLAMIILPATAIALFLQFVMPSNRFIPETSDYGLNIHIILSICAYSLLSIAALQAIILAIQDHQLKHKHPVRVMGIFPPMQTMEELLIELLWVGFFLLSMALATGFMFVHDIFGQHLSHKTALSIVAWFIYGLVLFGRWSWGWRGKQLVRWTLGGFVVLMLAYFGTKFVLELVLQRV
jgi:ABC-type uncharacterized transport system permease subunit